MDLNSISSNLLLIGFALVSICCLYLLYSNFTKVREIEELKRKVEDLKKIFFNTQQHNDETYSRILSMMQQQTILEHPAFPASNINTIEPVINNNSDNATQSTGITNNKIVNIDTSMSGDNNQPTTIIINKEGSVQDNNSKLIDNTPSIQNDTKEITLDLEELDNFEPTDEDNILDDLDDEKLDNLLNDEDDNDVDDENNNLENNETNDTNNTNNNINNLNIFEINNIDDTISITTDPINEDIDAIIGTIDMDEINTNTATDDFTIENLDDTNTILNEENIKKIDINLDDMDLNDILNGNTNTQDTTINTNNTTEHTTDNTTENTTTDIKNNLQNMSIKQLKDLAKIHKVKSTGTKTELITSLAKIL